MISGILGKKIGMTQIFKAGKCIPVTVIAAGPCTVLQVKTVERDGYCALQLGYGEQKENRVNKSEIGHVKKHAHTTPKKFIKEISWDGKEAVDPGHSVTVAIFEKMHYVDIVGKSKGKGFQGGMKRHGFRGGPKTHGQSDRLRAPGSIGCSATPSRVLKGKKMAGHMGNVRCTARNLEVIDVDPEQNTIAVKGAVPGPNGGYVLIKKSLIS